MAWLVTLPVNSRYGLVPFRPEIVYIMFGRAWLARAYRMLLLLLLTSPLLLLRLTPASELLFNRFYSIPFYYFLFYSFQFYYIILYYIILFYIILYYIVTYLDHILLLKRMKWKKFYSCHGFSSSITVRSNLFNYGWRWFLFQGCFFLLYYNPEKQVRMGLYSEN